MRARRRRLLAIAAVVLWLLGVETLPDLHLATHADDHSHAPDGSIVHRAAHSHGGIAHSHQPEKPERQRKQRVPPQLAFDDVPFAHVADGLAHRALALHQSTPPPLPLLALAPARVVERVPERVLVSTTIDRVRARDPPA